MLLFVEGSINGSATNLDNFEVAAIGLDIALELSILVRFKRSLVYVLWDKNRPSLARVTSIAMK